MFPENLITPPPQVPEYHMAGEQCSRCAQMGVSYPPTIQTSTFRVEMIAVHHPNGNPLAGTYLSGYALGGPYQQRTMVQSVNAGIGAISWQPCGVQTLNATPFL